MTGRTPTRRGAVRSTALVVLVALATIGVGCSSSDDGATATTTPPTTTPPTTRGTTPTTPDLTEDDLADVFVDAWRFTSSAAGTTALDEQARLVASCMSERGFEYRAEVAPPGTPAEGAVDYGLVDHFLAAGQDRANQAIEASLSPTDALAWREALNGPPRSQNEDTPVSDDPEVVGCGPAALPRFVGVEHAAALSQVVSMSVELLQTATASSDVVATRAAHDACLVAAGVGVGADDVTDGFAPFPLVRRWFAEAFPEDPATLRAAVEAGDAAVIATLDELRSRERSLYLADTGCDSTADPAAALDAAMARLSRDATMPAEQRVELALALDAARAAAADS